MNVKISIVTACCIGISFLHGGLLHTVRCFIAPGLYAAQSPPNIIDHTKRDIAKIPVQAIVQAKKKLHIAYGHTSHGQQLIAGMESLDSFMSKKGYAAGTFAVDFDGRPSGSELDLCDNPWKNWSDYGRDLGSRKTDGKMSDGDYTAWVYTTRKYLGWAPGSGDGSQLAHYATGAPRYNPSSCNNCNVIVWAWCGQVGYCPPQEIHNYLRNMTQLERDYPQVKFVYMTGHLARGEQKHDIGLNGSVHTRNTIIRNYCIKNNKILYVRGYQATIPTACITGTGSRPIRATTMRTTMASRRKISMAATGAFHSLPHTATGTGRWTGRKNTKKEVTGSPRGRNRSTPTILMQT